MRILKYPDDSTLKSCLLRPYRNLDELRAVVQPMLENIKKNGDKAVFEYEKSFDKVELQSLKVTEKEFKDADECLENELKAAISYAYQNIFKFHFQQLFHALQRLAPLLHTAYLFQVSKILTQINQFISA